jgi:protein-tyrosine-phosphatase
MNRMGPTRRFLFARQPPELPEPLLELSRSLEDFEAQSRVLLSRLTSTSAPRFVPTVDARADRPFRMVFVCTGNQFRSPIAEAVAARLTEGLPILVTSCGISARAGRPPLPGAMNAARRLGIDISEHRSRRLTSLAESDLVLGFEFGDLAGAVIDGGAPPDRSFMLTEAVELLVATGTFDDGGDRPISASELVTRLSSARGGAVAGSGYRSLLDPAAAPPRVQREIASEIVRLTQALLAPLVHQATRASTRLR